MFSLFGTKPMNDVISSSHKFMVNLYQVLAEDEENTFFSPFSIYVVLILAYLGSKGETAEELEKHLFVPKEREQFLEGLQNLLNGLKRPQLNTATEMFVERSYKLQASYKDSAKKFVNSESQLVDFKTDPAKATELINSWVSSRTNKKINDLIPAGIIDEDTRLVLVNAIHFKDKWLYRFPERDTLKEKFFTSKDSFTEVDMMYVRGKYFSYKEEETFKVLALPYKNEEFKMVIFLPKEIDGLAALGQKLPEFDITNILSSMRRVTVRVTLPKFRVEKFIDLNDALKKLGIERMFDKDKADFTGIHEPTEARLVVSKVLHKAFVEVNEEGTEAAAATAGQFVYLCAPIEYTFTADHPFIYFIFHGYTPLFIGKLSSVI